MTTTCWTSFVRRGWERGNLRLSEHDMNDGELAAWFAANKTLLEVVYLAGEQAWQQQGYGANRATSA